MFDKTWGKCALIPGHECVYCPAHEGKTKRRVRIIDVNGSSIGATYKALNGGTIPGVIEVTGVPHANSQSPMYIIVEERCHKLIWHEIDRMRLGCWGND